MKKRALSGAMMCYGSFIQVIFFFYIYYNICLGKGGYQENIFSYFSMKTYVLGTHKKCLNEVLLMSTHNICLHGKIRKYINAADWQKHLIRSYGYGCFTQVSELWLVGLLFGKLFLFLFHIPRLLQRSKIYLGVQWEKDLFPICEQWTTWDQLSLRTHAF